MKIATIPNSCTAEAARGGGWRTNTTAAVGYASLARGLLFFKRLQRYAVAIGDLRVVAHCKPQALLWYRCQSTYWRRVAVQQQRIAAIFDGNTPPFAVYPMLALSRFGWGYYHFQLSA